MAQLNHTGHLPDSCTRKHVLYRPFSDQNKAPNGRMNPISCRFPAKAYHCTVYGGVPASTEMLNPVGHVGMVLSLKRPTALTANDDVELAYAA